MTDQDWTISNLVDQWATFLAARILFTFGLSDADLSKKVHSLIKSASKETGAILQKGYDISKETDLGAIKKMVSTIDPLIKEFATTKKFPQVFEKIMTYTSELIGSRQSETPQGKSKALHTDEIVNDEILNEFDLLSCEIFIYISSILKIAYDARECNFDQIPKGLIPKIVVFLDHDQPKSVRASAGEIISALSISPNLVQEISTIFWTKFSKCKKDDDYRNFASWIDGVQKIQLSLATPQVAETTIEFLTNFVKSAPKKIERGVLRMQFLSALTQILTRINLEVQRLSQSVQKATEYSNLLTEIKTIVLKWSSKAKHTLFCYQFINNLFESASIPFFLANGPSFLELISKFVSKQSGDPDSLQLIATFIRAAPKDYYDARAEDFATVLNLWVIPLLFPGLDKGKPQLKFSSPEQSSVIITILLEIGKKKVSICVDVFKAILQLSDPKSARHICIQALSQICQVIPQSLKPYNTQLYPLTESILLSLPPSQPDEFLYAIYTFPTIHSENSTKLSQVSQVLFDQSTNETANSQISKAATESLNRFISTLVSLTENPLPPINYMSKLFETITLPKLNLLLELINSFSQAMDGEDFTLISEKRSPLSNSDWQAFRFKVDSTLLPQIIIGGEFEDISKQIILAFKSDSFKALDKACKITFTLTNILSQKLSELPTPVNSNEKLNLTKISIQAIEIGNGSAELAQKLFNSLLTYWRNSEKKLDQNQNQKLIIFLCGIVRQDQLNPNQTVSLFFEELFKLLRNSDQPNALSALNLTEWVPFITELHSWMGVTGLTPQTFWNQYVSIHHSFAIKPEFLEQIKKDSKLAECYERFLIGFYKRSNEPKKMNDFLIVEKCFNILNSYAKSLGVEKLIDQPTSFILSLEKLIPLEFSSEFPKTYMETFLRTLQTVFESFDINSLKQPNTKGITHDSGDFLTWLAKSLNKLNENEQVIIQGSTLLTLILTKNSGLLNEFIFNSFIEPIEFLLATANSYSLTDDLIPSHVLALALLHIYDEEQFTRQAVYKLIMEIFQKPNIFIEQISINDALMIAAQTTFGYEMQADKFVDLINNSSGPELLFQLIEKLAEFSGEIKGKQAQNGIVDAMSLFVQKAILLPNLELNDLFSLILMTTTRTQSKNNSTVSIIKLWEITWKSISDSNKSDEEINKILSYVFEWGTGNLQSDQSGIITATQGIVAASTTFPKLTSELLLKVLSKYDKNLPENLAEFSSFLKNANLDFEPSAENILTYNTLSQIFLLIPSKEEFLQLYLNKLPIIMFFAIMNYSREEFTIPPYHPLLDALIDTALFRFGENKDNSINKKLSEVQNAGLLRRSSSLEPQYSIVLEEQSHNIMYYDHSSIALLLHLFNEVDSEFTSKFIVTCLSTGFLIDNKSQWAAAPFIMLTSLAPELSSRNVFFMLLYSVYAFLTKNDAIIDALFDNIQARIQSQIVADEALPILIVLTLYLRLNLKHAQVVHLVKVLSDGAKRILLSEDNKIISEGLINFLTAFHDDEFIVSSLLSLLQNAKTMKDISVNTVIEALVRVSPLLESTSLENSKKANEKISDHFQISDVIVDELPKNGCSLIVEIFQILPKMVGILPTERANIAKDFALKIIKNYKNNYICFIVKLLASWRKTFHCSDYGITDCVLELVSAIIIEGKVWEILTVNDVDGVSKSMVLNSIGAEDGARRRASAALVLMLKNKKLPANSYRLSLLRPKITNGLADIELLPELKLFYLDIADERDLVRILKDTITAKLTSAGESVPTNLLE